MLIKAIKSIIEWDGAAMVIINAGETGDLRDDLAVLAIEGGKAKAIEGGKAKVPSPEPEPPASLPAADESAPPA